MTESVAYRFIEALARLEQDEQLDPITATFDEACEIGNSLSPDKFHGKQGAVEYWRHYRANFRHMRSSFRHIIPGEHSIALEWTTTATDNSGKHFNYDGVSILDIAGDQIVRFRAYIEGKRLGDRILPQTQFAAATAAPVSKASAG